MKKPRLLKLPPGVQIVNGTVVIDEARWTPHRVIVQQPGHDPHDNTGDDAGLVASAVRWEFTPRPRRSVFGVTSCAL